MSETMDVEEKDIPQSKPLAQDQVLNDAGGFTWKVDDMSRLRRFLCFGAEGGTYYTGEKELALENARCVQRLIETNKGTDVVNEIVNFSVEGRAAKQNSIIFALAMCARQEDDPDVKRQAYNKLNDVLRIPTHLFQFVEFSEKLSRGTGWGRAHRRAISNWYLRFADKPKHLAQHVTKYRNRNGWSHKDLLRLSHPKPDNQCVAAIIKYVVKGMEITKEHFLKEDADEDIISLLNYLQAVEDVKNKTEVADILKLIKEHKLVREHIPTSFLNNADIWRELLNKMPMTAMIRNLGKMSSIGILTAGSNEENQICSRLHDEAALKDAKIHPFNVLVALNQYQKGKGDKGKLIWDVNQNVRQALNGAFYKCFKNVEPTGQRFCLAMDVSGSMSWGNVNGCNSINPREASAALSMVTARTEASYEMVAFSTDLVPLSINADMDLPRVIKTIESCPMGGTDCAQPMLWASKNDKKFDVFIIYTDCETWAGEIHPAEALRQYRQKSGIWHARLIICAMTSNGFTLADPEDPGMMDMAGFDTNGPEIMRNFILGLI